MKILKFAAVFVPVLAFVPFLPLYIVQSVTNSQMSEGGDVITRRLTYTTLYNFLSHYNYSFWYESSFFWVALNTGLAFLYALLVTLAINRVFASRQRSD